RRVGEAKNLRIDEVLHARFMQALEQPRVMLRERRLHDRTAQLNARLEQVRASERLLDRPPVPHGHTWQVCQLLKKPQSSRRHNDRHFPDILPTLIGQTADDPSCGRWGFVLMLACGRCRYASDEHSASSDRPPSAAWARLTGVLACRRGLLPFKARSSSWGYQADGSLSRRSRGRTLGTSSGGKPSARLSTTGPRSAGSRRQGARSADP